MALSTRTGLAITFSVCHGCVSRGRPSPTADTAVAHPNGNCCACLRRTLPDNQLQGPHRTAGPVLWNKGASMMKRFGSAALLGLIALAALSAVGRAAPDQPAGKIRVLLIDGQNNRIWLA